MIDHEEPVATGSFCALKWLMWIIFHKNPCWQFL